MASSVEGVTARRVALEALARIDDDGAYANLVLSAVLDRNDADLSSEDRGFLTDLVYGTVRRRRACDHLVDRFLTSDPPPAARRALRLGAYQLAFRNDLPDYAVVSATVAAAPKRFRGLVNAVLRRVATAPVEFPDDATRLSYPDWIVERLVADLGHDDDGRGAGIGRPQAQTGRQVDDGQDGPAQVHHPQHMRRGMRQGGGGGPAADLADGHDVDGVGLVADAHRD